MEKIKGFFGSRKVRNTLLIGCLILGSIYVVKKNKPNTEVTNGSGTWEELGEVIEEASE